AQVATDVRNQLTTRGHALRRRPRTKQAGLVAILVVLTGAALCSSSNAQIVANPILNVERAGHTATPLADGRILIAGGENASGAVGESELYDPASRTFLPGPLLLAARALHTATRLSDGRVLIAGGISNGAGIRSTELYDPAANAFLAGPSMNGPRTGHTATTLADGRILIAGGNAQGTAEIYNPATGRFALLSGRRGFPRPCPRPERLEHPLGHPSRADARRAHPSDRSE